jgi:phosphatidylglycerol:prolipoprotein diacylglycerol transferase
MLPILFKIGSIPIYSFGLMMGIAFLVANYFFTREMRRRGLSGNGAGKATTADDIAGNVTLIALVAGVVGSKLFSLLENWDAFLRDPVHETFSASGLTFYGGLILATLMIYLYVRSKGIPFMRVADSAAPSLILAYGIGRIGCQLSGDGDYGIPSTLPWAMGYPNGTVSTLAEKNPELVAKFRELFPGQAIPADIMVHPAPVYETLAAVAIFAFLWWLRKKGMPVGKMFAIYLICAGAERLLVEFIRLNPLYLGLSQAQWISVGMIAVGSAMIVKLRNAPPETLPSPRTTREQGARSAAATVGSRS